MRIGKLFNTLDAYGLIFLRLGLGTIFIAHGAQKVFGWFGGPGFEETLAYFQDHLGVPFGAAVLAMLTEFLGGLAVLIGLLTRIAALGLAIVMAVVISQVHWGHGFFLNWPCSPEIGHGFEYNLALMAMALTLVCTGPGKLSADKWISEL
jgi:putative oxidoreductase